MFFKEKWFWRGTQSAAFYYLGCTPCVDWNYKRNRKNEALRLEKERVQRAKTEVVTEQPGVIPQPLPFHTNKAWAEEILAGPGPPSGWQREDLGGQLRPKPKRSKKKKKDNELSTSKGKETVREESGIPLGPVRRISTIATETRPEGRPGHERKTSTIDALRDTFRTSLHPESWNWIRYEREDEILSGANAKLSSLWDRAKGNEGRQRSGPHRTPTSRARADTNDSDQYDYYRARHPELNQYHPPIVSQLPAKREDVAWILLPPPSAAVMEGRIRPGADSAWRQPLSRIGRSYHEMGEMRQTREILQTQISSRGFSRGSEAVDGDDDLTSGTTTSTPRSHNSNNNNSSVWESEIPPLALINSNEKPSRGGAMEWDWGVVEVK